MASSASTPEQYLAELTPERREAIGAVRDLVNEHLPDGYVEHMAHGMITWSVPLDRFPDTYNGEPLGYLALASNKSGMSLYLMGLYAEDADWFRAEYAKSGKRLDLGKSCLRFKSLDALALEPVAEAVARHSVDDYIALYRRARG